VYFSNRNVRKITLLLDMIERISDRLDT